MSDENEMDEASASPLGIGERLATERKSQGLDLTTIAERTRVPIRHLEAIEKSDFASLPGATYTLGFARSYARSLGMDAAEVSAELRQELNAGGHDGYNAPAQSYEPTDPARIPSRALAWTAALLGVLLVAGYFIWRSSAFDGGNEEASQEVAAGEAEVGNDTASANAAPDPSGDVVLTANDTVWLRIYDADNKRLFEKEMQKGESFTVPKDANKPMINTGRAQAIDVTIGGQKVAALAEPDIPVKDIEVSAQALLARDNAAATGANSDSEANSGQ